MCTKLEKKFKFKSSNTSLMKLITAGVIIIAFALPIWSCLHDANPISENQTTPKDLTIVTGAEQTQLYFPLLKNKKSAIVTNHTAVIGQVYLVDSLIRKGFEVKKIFCPEHGFRGEADAGENIADSIDAITNIPLVSLYGKKKKPDAADLKSIEIMLFDIQDVGVRFYTYISTLHYIMEACAENNIPLIILDRPNPNGFYIDGPVLEPANQSFVGMHPVPIVHACTIGEYAQMLNGEKWLKNEIQCSLTIIPIKNYTHQTYYKLSIPPSPNLTTMNAIYLYPSLCLFEGTVISVGRGTDFPFQVVGNPTLKDMPFSFTPVSKTGSKNPLYKNQVCYGLDLRNYNDTAIPKNNSLQLKWLMQMYKAYPNKDKFFNPFFTKLAGTTKLQTQIQQGLSEADIRKGWQKDIADYKKIRKKYLLYPDFE